MSFRRFSDSKPIEPRLRRSPKHKRKAAQGKRKPPKSVWNAVETNNAAWIRDGRCPNVNEPQANGTTALHYVAQEGAVECLKALLDQGVDVNQTDSDGWTALMVAVENTKLRCVEALLHRGSDVNKRLKRDGRTALMLAMVHSEPCAEVLMNPKYGIRIDILDNQGDSALAYAVRYRALGTTKRLLALGADPNQLVLNDVGRKVPVLLAAAAHGLRPYVDALLDAQAQANIRLSDGTTALSLASQYGRLGSIKALLQRGANPNLANDLGITPLMLAAGNRHAKCVATLLNAGADHRATNEYGLTALHYAASQVDVKCVALLLFTKDKVVLADVAKQIPLHQPETTQCQRLLWRVLRIVEEEDETYWCVVCGRFTDYLCARCNSVAYCEGPCESQDRERHEADCKALEWLESVD